MQKNNLVFITFDSCRYDTFAAAKTPNIDRLGATEQRFSFASWTVPAHTVYLMVFARIKIRLELMLQKFIERTLCAGVRG